MRYFLEQTHQILPASNVSAILCCLVQFLDSIDFDQLWVKDDIPSNCLLHPEASYQLYYETDATEYR